MATKKKAKKSKRFFLYLEGVDLNRFLTKLQKRDAILAAWCMAKRGRVVNV